MDYEFWQEMKAKGLFGGKPPLDESENSENPVAVPHTQTQDDSGKGKIPESENERLTEANTASFSEELSENGINQPLERFSFFNKGHDSATATSTGTIEAFIHQVQTNAGWKMRVAEVRRLEGEQRKAKKDSLPAVTVSVEIKSADKKRGGLREGEFVHTNLIQVDIDNPDDPQALREKLIQDPHMRAMFDGPSGTPKAFIKVLPVRCIHEHDSAWKAVVDYCQAQGDGKIDEKVRSINALCFISHDPNALLKEATPLQWERLPEPPLPRTAPTRTDTHSQQEKPSAARMQEILSFIDADDYEIWMGIGMGLYREGYDFEVWDTWSQSSPKYGKPPTTTDKMEAKWETFGKESVRSEVSPITLGSIYHHAKEGGWTKPAQRNHRHSYATHQLIYHRRR